MRREGELLLWEHKWLKSPLYFYPENEDLISAILGAKFEGKMTAIHSEYNQFSIAIPKSARFAGAPVQGIFVSITSYDETKQQILDFLHEHDINLTLDKHFILPPHDGKMFHISYRITSNDVTETVCRTLDDFPDYIKANQNETQNEVIRFVLGFLIYISCFKDVVHDAPSISMPKRATPDRKYKAFRVNFAGSRERCRFHLRNLKHPKYYKGEYEVMERGSRWVPVNGSIKTVSYT